MRIKQKYWLYGILALAIVGVILSSDYVDRGNPPQKPAPNHPVSFPQKFHVQGNKIVNEAGKEVVLRGLDLMPILGLAYDTETGGLKEDDSPPWGEELFRKMNEWGAKIIRLEISPQSWRIASQDSAEVEGYDKEKAFEVIDQAIRWSSKYNMYVIIDYHGGGWPPTEKYSKKWCTSSKEEIIDFWDEISERYKDNNVVAFYEIFNEPADSSFLTNSKLTEESLRQDWLVWKEFNEKVIDIIRANDPDTVIIVGGLLWGYLLTFAEEYPIERGNVVYATHPYPPQYSKLPWDDAFGNIKEKYPVFATEFGFSDQVPEGIRSSQDEDLYTGPGIYRDEIKKYLESKKISWIAFRFSIKGPNLLKDQDYTPTASGEFFRDWLLEKR